MPNITVLDQSTINQIAAGEVVERPSSVVKELIENAIDANATAITAEIKEGGIKFIRITDNGAGIDTNEIPVAFLRHATSKIKSVEDLMSINSLGFRGEALSSIASVAQVELVTKTRTALTGARYIIEGGEEQGLTEIGCPDGTTFLVRNLFFNTPARRKFLKSPVTEAGYISELMERLAISHPEISFKFINNNKTVLHTFGNRKLKDIIFQIYGKQITEQLVSVEGKGATVSLSGFVGKPIISRGNRNFENYFINGRYIKSAIIGKAIEEAYRPYTMQHKYPFTVLHFEIQKDLLDVNVHPTKMEIRFHNAQEIYDLTLSSIRSALSHQNMIPDVLLVEEPKAVKEEYKEIPEPFETKRIQLETKRIPSESRRILPETNKTFTYQPSFMSLATLPKEEKPPSEVTMVQETFIDQVAQKKSYEIIGQVFKTYWIVECEEQMYLIDQHAAHEKVLFEATMKRLQDRQGGSQMVSPPIILTLNLKEEVVMNQYKEQLEQLGFEYSCFGGREYAVNAVPADMFGLRGERLLIELIDDLVNEAPKGTPDLILEKIASMSCKAAVKGNHKLSEQEAKSLIEQLMQLDNPFHCPHGRPVIVSMTKYELEKKFKRIV